MRLQIYAGLSRVYAALAHCAAVSPKRVYAALPRLKGAGASGILVLPIEKILP